MTDQRLIELETQVLRAKIVLRDSSDRDFVRARDDFEYAVELREAYEMQLHVQAFETAYREH